MSLKRLIRRVGFLLLASILFVGCSGSNGNNGAPGAAGLSTGSLSGKIVDM